MTEPESPWWPGANVDHLYEACPIRRRSWPAGEEGSGTVDPLGEEICGWCARVWKARNRSAPYLERGEVG